MRSRVEDDSRYGLVITIEMVGLGHRHCDMLVSRTNNAAIDTVRSESLHQHVLVSRASQLPSRWSNKVDINRNTLVSMASHERPHRESSSGYGLAATLEIVK